jgi:hypothetical protein
MYEIYLMIMQRQDHFLIVMILNNHPIEKTKNNSSIFMLLLKI